MSPSFRFLNINSNNNDNAVNGCTIDTQKDFGPTNAYCYGGFDFTLFFEETFLSMVPFALILPFLLVRLYRLNKATIVVDGGKWHLAKQVRKKMYHRSVMTLINPS
jgi:ATP-binding cassette subfamily C (CFTR/MRP) protein 1